jgi:L-amino acid N-acyltransferase YncA
MINIRPAQPEDAATIVEIYNQGIRARGATFQTQERTVDDIQSWFNDPKHPLLVALLEDSVVGWIHASPYRAASLTWYAGIAEYSVYVSSSAHGQGVGLALMLEFFKACEAVGIWKILSRIFPENTASLALCAKTGFREVGVYQRHAMQGGVWRDVVIVEKLLEAQLLSSPKFKSQSSS